MGRREWREEFEAIALVHLDRLYHMALRLCQNRTEAEDLVQESYLKAFRHFDQFAPGTNCRAWLFAILHNTFLSRVKRQGREVLGPDEEELERGGKGISETMAALPTPEEELLRHAVDADLVRALEQLPLRFREVVLLADLEECSYKEIARICGIPSGTVMSRLHRGRQQLRKALAATFREQSAAGKGA